MDLFFGGGKDLNHKLNVRGELCLLDYWCLGLGLEGVFIPWFLMKL